MIQAHIYFSGMVQGVGFRYTVHRYASGLSLCGWVKNLPDGRVEAMIQGEREDIDQLVKRLDEQFDGYIKDKDVTFDPAQNTFKDFRIAF